MKDPLVTILKLLPQLSYDELKMVAIRTGKLRILTPKNGSENGSKSPQSDNVVGSSSSRSSTAEEARALLQFLNEKTGKNFRANDVNLTFIEARLRSGASVEDCRGVIARKCREWKDTPQAQYLRPATLFNATKFEQYLGEQK